MIGVFHLLSQALGWLAAATFLPALIGFAVGDRHSGNAFLLVAVLLGFLSGAAIFALRGRRRGLSRVGSYVLILGLWLIVPLVAAIPLALGARIPYVTALFEAVSGFTTTGASAIGGVRVVGTAGIFFRAELQWLGGFVSLVTVATVLAATGLGGLSRSQVALVSGVEDRLSRIMIGVRQIFVAYAAVTVLCMVLLILSGIPPFESICIALSTLSTGGFMPIDGTFAQYDNPFANVVVSVFMLVGATSIVWQRMVAEGRWYQVRQHRESYWVVGTAVALGIVYTIAFADPLGLVEGSQGDWITGGLLTGISLVTTTGFEAHPGAFVAIPAVLALVVALVGASGLSTAGGLKQYRIGALLTLSSLELRRLIYPHSVHEPRVGSIAFNLDMMKAILSYLFVSLLVLMASVLLLSLSLPDFQAAITAAIAAFSNIGALYAAGWHDPVTWTPYAEYDAFAKLVFIVTMILGRLEVLVVFAAFNLSYWRS
ncbi:MAG: TrkH family potassium uptake protein [Rhizobiales bacterium]|nr:TrkH family potassium uptake protein [Hyphomicrobiales bacterium]